MKRSQIIMFGLFILVSGLVFFRLMQNKKEDAKEVKEENTEVFVPVRKVKNELRSISLVSYGQVASNLELAVSFEVQGKLQKGQVTMKPGTNFRKGQLLYKVNNEEAFYTLSARKSALTNLILNIMPDIEMDYPSELTKWGQFLNDLRPDKKLPELPATASGKEKRFITSRNIYTEYYNLKSLEARMSKYKWFAPFSGTVVATIAEPGAIVNPGAQIAKIIQTSGYEVKVPISMDDIDEFKNRSKAEFIDPSGKKIANGKIIRVSNVINQQTQSADVYYSITPLAGEKIYSGMFVNVSIERHAEKKTMTIPRAAMRNGKVNVLEGEKIHSQEVLIVGSKPDSLFTTGLKNGQLVLLEQIDQIKSDITYKGITR